jgi:hypothetical protein
VIGVSAGVALASTPGTDAGGAGQAGSRGTPMHAGAGASGQLASAPGRVQGKSDRTQSDSSQSGRARSDRSQHGQSGGSQPGSRTAGKDSGQARTRQWPYLIYDSVDPSEVPADRVLAAYATGPFAVSPAQVAGHKAVLWIDVVGTDPAASAVDVEPGDVTPNVVPSWVSRKLTADPRGLAVIYTSRAEWPVVQSAVSTLPTWMISRIRWWIADPTGYPHVLPGSSATQWYWGSAYDISTALPDF